MAGKKTPKRRPITLQRILRRLSATLCCGLSQCCVLWAVCRCDSFTEWTSMGPEQFHDFRASLLSPRRQNRSKAARCKGSLFSPQLRHLHLPTFLYVYIYIYGRVQLHFAACLRGRACWRRQRRKQKHTQRPKRRRRQRRKQESKPKQRRQRPLKPRRKERKLRQRCQRPPRQRHKPKIKLKRSHRRLQRSRCAHRAAQFPFIHQSLRSKSCQRGQAVCSEGV